VYAGQPWAEEAMGPRGWPKTAQAWPGRNFYLFRGGLRLVWQRGILKWLGSFQPEAMILEANPRNLSNSRIVAWMQAHKGPVVGWGLGAPPFIGPLAKIQNLRRHTYLQNFDALITYSRRGAQEFAAAGFDPQRIYIAPNAITPSPAGQVPDRPLQLDEPATLLFVGRLQARKRVDDLLMACAKLPENIRPQLWIVGEGPARTELQSLARQTYPRAYFYGDRRGSDLDELFNQADLFVLPGTGGLAVQQAMAHALPVIVAEADGTQADLVRPENGWCLQTPGPSSLRIVLQQALSDRVRLRRMGLASWKIVREEINIEKMVEVFLRALQTISV
jgi:glycosyltransferase involved in cell wall biosynthesis